MPAPFVPAPFVPAPARRAAALANDIHTATRESAPDTDPASVDLDALIARLADAGFTSIEDEPLEGYDRRYVTNPFGNRIELMQPCGAVMMIDDSASGSAE